MKATVLVDNIPGEGLGAEWGLSIFIGYRGKNILLDAGQSALFAENADSLGIDLSTADLAVLSHAHYDHANGMDEFFRRNNTAKFYLRCGCGENCYAKKQKLRREYIGIRKGYLKTYADRIAFVDGVQELLPGVFVLGHTTSDLAEVGRREKMFLRYGLRWQIDDFRHEQSLVFRTGGGLVIFNSCSHGGAANITAEVQAAFPGEQIRAFIGGFHLYNKTDEEVRAFAQKIRETGVGYICTGHCTGDRAWEILSAELGDIMHRLHAGLVMEFDD